MTILSNINYFKELPFFNAPIEKPKINRLKNVDLLAELPFYEKLSITKTNQAFKGYAMSYRVKLVEKKDPIVQLETSKLTIKDLFSNLFGEINSFKYQITVKIVLKNIS